MTMRMARIVCGWRDPKASANETLCILAGIDATGRLVDGEWMGYVRSSGVTYPFVLDDAGARLVWGPEDRSFTNIGQKTIARGELFTVQAWEPHEPDYVYEVRTVHVLA